MAGLLAHNEGAGRRSDSGASRKEVPPHRKDRACPGRSVVIENKGMKILLCAASALFFIAACSTPREGETSYSGRDILSPREIIAAKQKPVFEAHIKPILETRCVVCHNAKVLPGRMSLVNRKSAMASGKIIPGHPEQSLLVANIKASHAGVNAMPPVGERITKDELAILTEWIKQGAEWPEGRVGSLNPNGAP